MRTPDDEVDGVWPPLEGAPSRPQHAPHREQPLASIDEVDAALAELRADAEAPRGDTTTPQVRGVSHATGTIEAMTWPDTTTEPPPAYDTLGSARWLLGRHPDLAHVAALIPGVVTVEAGELDVDLPELAQGLTDLDAWQRAWMHYELAHRPPDGPVAYRAWCSAGPAATPAVQALAVLADVELVRLRLLATFSFGGVRSPFAISDLERLDNAGRRLLADWLLAVTAIYPY